MPERLWKRLGPSDFDGCAPVDPLLDYPLRAEVAQLVEHNLAKVGVAGSSPVFRSIEASRTGMDT